MFFNIRTKNNLHLKKFNELLEEKSALNTDQLSQKVIELILN